MSGFGKIANNVIKKCVSNIDFNELLKNKTNTKYFFETQSEYNDFLYKEVIDFVKNFKPDDINTIIYNKSNSDGLFSASIVYHYLTELGKQIEIIRLGAGFGNIKKNFKKIKGKNIIILDLSYDNDEYNEIKKVVNKCYSIDDHDNQVNDKNIFIGTGNFASCVYTWKIFYPREDVPLIIQYIGQQDNKDSKTSKFIKSKLANLVTSPITFRYTSSPYIKDIDFKNGKVLNDIWKIIEDSDPTFWIFIGKYMSEVLENIKEQIAKNAYEDNFQGFKVGVLNFLDPVLTKKVGKQIVSNFQKKGNEIDFAFLWGYDNGKKGFNITLLQTKTTKYNIPKIAKIMGRKGGHRNKGHGHRNAGHFYWPKDKTHDIWDLFTKKILTDKERKSVIRKTKKA